ncbi:MAG: prenyltransferase/squalene oxidase repeat-containing protein [Verrucomicrobiota bacterium]
MAERFDLLKRHSLALFLATACAGLPVRLFAADPNPSLSPLVAGAWMGFDYPLLKIFLSLAIAALLLVALLKRCHRPELLAVCLALSIVMHLLSLSLFSLMSFQRTKREAAPKTVVSRIKVGTSILRESQVSQSIRAEPLKTERVDTQNRLSPDRAVRSEPVKEVISKAQANLRETEARTAGHGEFKTPAVTPPKNNMDEPLDVVLSRPIEVATVKIAIPQKDQRAPEAKQVEPVARAKQFDIVPVAQASMPPQAVKPSATRAERKDPAQLPVRATIDLVAVALRQPEVKDAIQPAIAKSTVDRLELRAREVANTHGSGKDERIALAKPSADVKLDKRAGNTPRTTEQRMTAAAKSAGQPRMVAASLAAERPDRIERKKNEMGGLSLGATAAATRLEPVRMSDVQPLVAVTRPDVPGQIPASAPTGQRELTTSKEKSAVPGVNAVGGIERPSLTGRSDLPVSQDSFVGQGTGVATPRAASLAVSEGEQVETTASLTLAGGNAKALAGRMSAESMQDERGIGGGEGEGDRGPAELSLGKAGGYATASGISVKRFQALGSTAGGQLAGGLSAAPAGTLVVQSGLQVVGRARASGPAGKESLAALNTSASASDSSGPTLVAPTVMCRGLAAGGTAEAGSVPVGGGRLQVAKAGGADQFLFEPQGGGGLGELAETMSGASERDPSRMDLSLSAGPPKARVTADISASSSGPAARHSFLSVGTTPNPEFVPEKAIYKMRKPEKRRQFIKELGGTAQTEEAVEQALAWLSRAQSDDGRWDIDAFKTLNECGGAGNMANEDVGLTGLVLLAYLGAGYTHLDGAYQETVRKGLDWLLNGEKEDGDIRGAGQMYGQAMATTALCESYSLTGDERLLAPTQRAVKFILNSQTPESGWRYMSRNDSDTSVTGWQILALKSAQIAGFAVPDQTFKWMDLWLDKVRQGNDGGLYSYKPGHVVTPVMTAEGAFCQLFMGEQASARAQAESVAFIMQNLPVWNPESRSVHIYYWYYATLTMYLSGAKEFEAWNSALTKALLQGHSTSGPAAGSWDPVCMLGSRGGRVYSTAVGALCLEVYYRFLPLYKQKRP